MQEPHSHVRPEDHGLWSCPDEEATEREVTEFVAALVRATKPKHVVEIGTYQGDTAQAMAHALHANGRGHLTTFEVDPERAGRAIWRLRGLPVHVVVGDGNDRALRERTVLNYGPPDIVFIDGHLHNRGRSWEVWSSYVWRPGYVVFHDSLKYPEVKGVVDAIDRPKIHLRTPRGLTVVEVS